MKKWFFPFVIIVVIFFCYQPVLRAHFVNWDDETHLLNNLSVHAFDQEHIKEIFTTRVHGTYIPLTLLTFMIEHHVWGFNPFIYHLDNLILHILVSLLIYCLAQRLGLSSWAAGAAAVLFGIHPMHVESVAWVTERKDVLYAFFYMLALLTYLKHLDVCRLGKSVSLPKKPLWWPHRFLILTTIWGFLSILAKPMALSLPFILLLLDWFQKRSISRREILEKLPLFIMMALMAWLSYIPYARLPDTTLPQGALIWIWTFVFYLRQFFWPLYSVPIYRLSHPISLFQWDYALSVAVFILILILVIRFRRSRWLLFAFGYYFLSIFFLLRFDEVGDTNIVADRFMYLPSLGFCLGLGYGLQVAWNRLSIPKAKEALRKIVFAAVIGLLVITLGLKTYYQSKTWQNSLSLWQHQLKIFPQEYIALNNLALLLGEIPPYQEAKKEYHKMVEVQNEGLNIDFSKKTLASIKRIAYLISLYERASSINPSFVSAYYNLGQLYQDVGLIPKALICYRKVAELDPNYQDVYLSLGKLYFDLGDAAKSNLAYNQLLTLYPDDENVYMNVILAYNEILKKNVNDFEYRAARRQALEGYLQFIHDHSSTARSFFNLGYLYSEMGEIEEAISAYQTALKINPRHSESLYNLGNLLKGADHEKEALDMYQKAIEVDPRNSNAYLNIGIIYGRKGQDDKAKEMYHKALQVDPHNAKAYFNLAYMKEKEGNAHEAIDLYSKAIHLDPQNAESYYNLGNVYITLQKTSEAKSAYLKAVEINPNHMNAWVNLSILSFQMENFHDAARYCDEAVLLGYQAPSDYLRVLEKYR